MRIALLLGLVVLTIGVFLDFFIARAAWPRRLPRTAIFVWHSGAVSIVAAFALGLLSLSHDVVDHALSQILGAEKQAVHLAFADADEVPAAWNTASLVLSLGLFASLLRWYWLKRQRTRIAKEHRSLATDPPLSAAWHSQEVGIIAVDVAAIYCIPGKPGDRRILVTSGALTGMTESQIEAAVTHEFAHLDKRHHLSVAASHLLGSLFRWIGLMRNYESEIRLLVELEADDIAAKRHGRRPVASALLALGELNMASATPSVSLGMSDTSTALRIRRLMDAPPGTQGRLGATALCVLLLLLPLAVAAAPVLLVLNPSSTVNVGSSHDGDFVHHE